MIIFHASGTKDFRRLRESIDRKAWNGLTPISVEALYSPQNNHIGKKPFVYEWCFMSVRFFIVFPAAILQMPFFNKDVPK